MIKGSIQEEDITIVNIYAPNRGAPRYIRQMLSAIKGEFYGLIGILFLKGLSELYFILFYLFFYTAGSY